MTDARPEPPASFAFEVIVPVPLRFTPLGGLVIDTVGGVASTSQVRVVVPLVLSYASFARTSNVCEPCDRPAYAFGLVAVVELDLERDAALGVAETEGDAGPAGRATRRAGVDRRRRRGDRVDRPGA